MATSIEDIVMNDGVSGPAGAAQSAVERLAVGLGIAGASAGALQNVMSASSAALGALASRAKESGMTELAAAAQKAATETLAAEKAAEKETAELEKQAAAAQKAAAAEAEKNSAARTKGNDQLAGTFGIPTDEVQGLKMAIDAEVAVIKALAGLVESGAKIAIDAVTFKENTVAAFQTLVGTQTIAADLYEKALDLSEKTGLAKEVVVSDLKKLLASGMGEQEALKVVKAVADVGQVLGEDTGNAVKDIIAKIEAKGEVDSRSLTKLAAQGINLNEVYSKLAAETGKSVKEVEVAFKKGTLDPEKAIDALTSVLEHKFGDAAEKAGQTVPRLLSKIQEQFVRLFDGIDLSGVTKFLSGISEALSGDAGKKLQGSLEHLFNAIFGLFDKLGGGKGPAGVIDGIAKAIDAVAGMVETFGPPIVAIINVIISSIEILTEHWILTATITSIVWLPVLVILGALGALIGAVVAVVWALGEAFDAVAGVVESAWSAISGFFSGLSLDSLGSNMIGGIISGIEAAAGGLVSALTGTVMSAVHAAEAALGIKSPSTRLAATGANTSKGFELGILGGIDGVAGAAQKMAGAAIPANGNAGPIGGSAGGAAANGNGGGGNVFHIAFSPAVTVPGASSPEDAKKLGKAATQAGMEEFERNAANMLRRLGGRG